MKNLKCSLVILIGLGAAQHSPLPAEAKLTGFMIGDLAFKMPVPAGYCEPTGDLLTFTDTFASADPKNHTIKTFVACNRRPAIAPMDNYILLKAPVGSETKTFDKTEMLDGLDAVAKSPDSPKFNQQMTDEIGNNTQKAFGERVEVRGTFGFDGRDQDCVYIAGPLITTVKGESFNALAATCMTVVAGRLLTVNVYDFKKLYTVPQLKAQAHKVAMSVQR